MPTNAGAGSTEPSPRISVYFLIMRVDGADDHVRPAIRVEDTTASPWADAPDVFAAK